MTHDRPQSGSAVVPSDRGLRRLRLRDFRTLKTLDWEPHPGWNLLHGANGSGKSSLLEAIYLAATGKSFRTPNLAECRTHGSPGFWVEAAVERAGRWDLAAEYLEGGRRLTLQQKNSSIGEHLALLPIVLWSEAERDLVAGPSAVRRRFLDRAALLERPQRLGEHAELQRAMAQKRHLLAARGRAHDFEAWNDLLAPLIARRAAERRDLVERLERAAARLLERESSDLPAPRLLYRPSPVDALDGAEAVATALAAAAAGERERGQPLVGPQRDRVEVEMDEAAARRFASAGERKLLALALLAALATLLAEAGREPIVLLDDLDAELDRPRLALASRLFGELPQTVATSSRPEAFPGRPDEARWSLSDGVLSRA